MQLGSSARGSGDSHARDDGLSHREPALCCITSALRIFVRGSRCYNPCIKVERLHALCFDFVEVKAQTLVAYVGTPASITGTLHHEANLSFVYKEQRTVVRLQIALQDNSLQLPRCQL